MDDQDQVYKIDMWHPESCSLDSVSCSLSERVMWLIEPFASLPLCLSSSGFPTLHHTHTPTHTPTHTQWADTLVSPSQQGGVWPREVPQEGGGRKEGAPHLQEAVLTLFFASSVYKTSGIKNLFSSFSLHSSEMCVDGSKQIKVTLWFLWYFGYFASSYFKILLEQLLNSLNHAAGWVLTALTMSSNASKCIEIQLNQSCLNTTAVL